MDNIDVAHRLAEIRAQSKDNETAHMLQDKLLFETLEYISQQCLDKRCRSLALWALRVRKINFTRWYA